jgi:hypothetical protein
MCYPEQIRQHNAGGKGADGKVAGRGRLPNIKGDIEREDTEV